MATNIGTMATKENIKAIFGHKYRTKVYKLDKLDYKALYGAQLGLLSAPMGHLGPLSALLLPNLYAEAAEEFVIEKRMTQSCENGAVSVTLFAIVIIFVMLIYMLSYMQKNCK
jgi:uncharacterized protein YqgC (DUF456 family)